MTALLRTFQTKLARKYVRLPIRRGLGLSAPIQREALTGTRKDRGLGPRHKHSASVVRDSPLRSTTRVDQAVGGGGCGGLLLQQSSARPVRSVMNQSGGGSNSTAPPPKLSVFDGVRRLPVRIVQSPLLCRAEVDQQGVSYQTPRTYSCTSLPAPGSAVAGRRPRQPRSCNRSDPSGRCDSAASAVRPVAPLSLIAQSDNWSVLGDRAPDGERVSEVGV